MHVTLTTAGLVLSAEIVCCSFLLLISVTDFLANISDFTVCVVVVVVVVVKKKKQTKSNIV